MIRLLLLLLLPFAAKAETIRVASFNTELSRDGPGLLLRDIRRGDTQVQAVVAVLTRTRPDIVALQGVDWDLNGEVLAALKSELRLAGLDYLHHFSAQPNAGLETDLDLDGDGRTHGPGDAQGWGRFTGQAGIVVLSRYPIVREGVQDFTPLLWRNAPDAQLPVKDGAPFPSDAAHRVQRLSSVGHWVVPIETPFGPLDLLTFHAAPPVFDGLEDRNGLRNKDEILLWRALLDDRIGTPPHAAFVIAGDANLDPSRGEGRKEAIRMLLEDQRLQDPEPADPTGNTATVSWKAVGEMRVDYVLPSTHLRVVDAGIHWPDTDTGLRKEAQAASRHRLVWVDLAQP